MQSASRRLRQRNKRVQTHLGLVQSIARHYAACSPEPLDDLLQVGRLGLIRAADLYNSGWEVPFSAFARPHIRGAVLHYLRDVVPMIRPSRRQQERQGQLKRRVQALWQQDVGGAVASELEQALLLLPRRVALPDLESTASEAVGWPEDRFDGSQIRRAMQSLDPTLQAVVQAVVLRGESLRSVAKRQGRSAATVHRHLHRALRLLRIQLNPASDAQAC